MGTQLFFSEGRVFGQIFYLVFVRPHLNGLTGRGEKGGSSDSQGNVKKAIYDQHYPFTFLRLTG
jgi:hypothetical protein